MISRRGFELVEEILGQTPAQHTVNETGWGDDEGKKCLVKQ